MKPVPPRCRQSLKNTPPGDSVCKKRRARCVHYQTFSSFEELPMVFAPLAPAWILIREHAGRNDGLVPVTSQTWTNELVANNGTRKPVVQKEFPVAADHLNQVGWWDPQEAVNPLKLLQSVFKQKENYESQIRGVYLQIAQSL
jgi:hypothetical protein